MKVETPFKFNPRALPPPTPAPTLQHPAPTLQHPALHYSTRPLHYSTRPLHYSTRPLHYSTRPLHYSNIFPDLIPLYLLPYIIKDCMIVLKTMEYAFNATTAEISATHCRYLQQGSLTFSKR